MSDPALLHYSGSSIQRSLPYLKLLQFYHLYIVLAHAAKPISHSFWTCSLIASVTNLLQAAH
jgi:hypothetical protein